jgi:molybdopterin synthase sulfur carrier subunit
VKFLYFAWVRERIGLKEEEVEPPPSVTNVGELVDWLKGRGPGYEYALSEPLAIRIALDRVHAGSNDTAISGVKEVALFPPMTGG